MAVKRRVGFRIDPSREPGRWKRAGNRKLKMVSEPCGRGAGVLSPQRDAPVTASGCKQYTLPQHRGCIRKGTAFFMCLYLGIGIKICGRTLFAPTSVAMVCGYFRSSLPMRSMNFLPAMPFCEKPWDLSILFTAF